MVKLEAVDTRFGGIFYFHNMNDCNKFKHVFKDHWCNVKWKPPVEKDNFPECSSNGRKNMDEDPVKRAEDSLSWGFNLVKDKPEGNLTDHQKSIVESIMNNQK